MLREGYEPIINNMQVHVQSRLFGSRAECVTIDTNPRATVDSLISSFCAQKGISRSLGMTLYNSNNEQLKPHATLEAEVILDGSLLFLDDGRQIIMSQPRWGLLAITSFLIGLCCLLAVILIYVLTGGEIPFDYAVVIDAGSTHSQMLLYQWSGDKDLGTADVVQDDTCSVPVGIATMKNPEDILPCVNKLVQSVPGSYHSHSFLYFGATAGMRLLNLTSPRIAELTLSVVKCSLNTTGIVVKKVDVITGTEEGVSAWITTNFLLKTLHPKEESSEPWNSTFGALDMGGASTQYAFALNPEHISNSSYISKIRLYGHNYSIAADSYLCYGFMEASRRHQAMLVKDLNASQPIIDPCLPSGNVTSVIARQLFDQPCTQTTRSMVWFAENPKNKEKVFQFEGSSDYKKCGDLVKTQLDPSVCKEAGFRECAAQPPTFQTDRKFLAISSFFYITSFLNSTNVPLDEVLANLESWCNTTWPEMANRTFPPENQKYILSYCFGGVYVTHWLMQMYGFDNSTWENLLFQDKIGKNDLGWALGFMINASNAIPEEAPTPSSLSTPTFAVLVIISVLVLLISIAFMRKYFIERRRRVDPDGHTRLIEA